MSGIVTRWPLLLERATRPSDCDDGRVANDVLCGWLVEMAAAVVDGCVPLQRELAETGATVEITEARVAGDITGAGGMSVAGGVTEIYPDVLAVAARIRPSSDAADGVANGRCTVRFMDPAGAALAISRPVRDALIAAAHAARFAL